MTHHGCLRHRRLRHGVRDTARRAVYGAAVSHGGHGVKAPRNGGGGSAAADIGNSPDYQQRNGRLPDLLSAVFHCEAAFVAVETINPAARGSLRGNKALQGPRKMAGPR